MKNAIILHGYSDTPQSFWIPWLKTELEQKNYNVWTPQLPENTNPTVAIQLPFLLNNGIFTQETVIVGHSAGCPLILSVLQNIETKIKQAILVSGFASSISGAGGVANSILPASPGYDWQKIKDHVKDIIFLNSDNDPWGCDDKKGREMFDHLGGTLIIRHGEGHMGSITFNQQYNEFPFLLKLID